MVILCFYNNCDCSYWGDMTDRQRCRQAWEMSAGVYFIFYHRYNWELFFSASWNNCLVSLSLSLHDTLLRLTCPFFQGTEAAGWSLVKSRLISGLEIFLIHLLTEPPCFTCEIFSLITRLYFIPRGAIEANFITKFSICWHELVWQGVEAGG